MRPRGEGGFESVDTLTFFENKKVRYVWYEKAGDFFKVNGIDKDIECCRFYELSGLTAYEQANRSVHLNYMICYYKRVHVYMCRLLMR